MITQTVFKTKGASDGFRRFRLGEEGSPLKVLSVHDLVELQPFEGASNRTATVVLQKGEKTEYPLSYTLWRKARPGKIGVDSNLEEVKERTKKTTLYARPVNAADTTSPWVTSSSSTLTALQKIAGPSPYRAREGTNTGGLNGVYWIRIVDRRPDGLLQIENLHDVGNNKVKQVQALIEPDLVYPLLRGRDVRRWRAQPSAYILLPQHRQRQREGIEENFLKLRLAATYGYLKEFEAELSERADRRYYPKGSPFYTMRNVAKYTFAPYKVVWAGFGVSRLMAAVVGEVAGKAVIANQAMLLNP